MYIDLHKDPQIKTKPINTDSIEPWIVNVKTPQQSVGVRYDDPTVKRNESPACKDVIVNKDWSAGIEHEQPTSHVMSTIADNKGGWSRYPQLIREGPVRFTVRSLRRSRDLEDPTENEALNSEEVGAWRDAMHLEATAFQSMNCWDVVYRPHEEQMWYKTFVVKRKRDESGIVLKGRPFCCMWQRRK